MVMGEGMFHSCHGGFMERDASKPSTVHRSAPRSAAPAKRTRRQAVPAASPSEPFWRRKTLEEMNRQEWESLCDRCGRCCLVKLEDEDTGRVHFTNIACRLFESGRCRCRDYAHREQRVSDCVRLTPARVRAISWLPPTCAYRLIAEGKDLFAWHPLRSGDPASVHRAGISARGKIAAFEDDIPIKDYVDYIVQWPAEDPVSQPSGEPKVTEKPKRKTQRNKRG
jgi:uncharacterized cysteine cluster protein YcgN (CxxCxxCC family)